MAKEIKIAILVLGVIALSYWGYVFLKGKDIFQKAITVKAYYEDVDQLAVSAPVLINGVKVGNVTDVILSPNNIEQVEVRFTIEGVTHVPSDAVANLQSTSIMGGKAIEIVFGKPCPEKHGCLKDGDVLASKNLSLINSMLGVDMDEYINGVQSKISGITTEDGREFNYAQILLDLQNTIENLKTVSEKAGEIISSSSSNVRNITNSMESFTANLNANDEKISQVMDNLAVFSEKLKNVEINKTVHQANGAVEEAKLAITEIKGTLENAKGTFDRINTIVTGIEEGKGSLGLLVNDEELYRDLSATSDQINYLLQDMRLNPKRYINVSIFGRKKGDPYTYPEDDPAPSKGDK